MSINETTIQVADPSAPVRNDYDFNLTDPNKMSVGNILALAKLAARGGMSDPKGAEGLAIRAVFAIQMGFSPVEGMQGLYLIEGKPVVGAQLLGAGIRRSGRYDYKVIEHDATKCVLEGFRIENGQKESLGMASFTMAEATAAGLADKAIWKKYPQNMLYARAMANLYRWHMPDLIGMPFYTEGEDPEPAEPMPSVQEQAAAAAVERAAKGRKKAEPEPPKDNVIEAEFKQDQPVPLHVDMNPAPETVTVQQMAENPISAGQFDPLDDTAPQNRFALIEGWGDPEPVEGLTPDLGVVGYHHLIKKRDDGAYWAVFDRESGMRLEKVQVAVGNQEAFQYLCDAMQTADGAYRAKDAALNKLCEDKLPNGNPSNKAAVSMAVRAVRQAKAKPAEPVETAPAPSAPSAPSGDDEAVVMSELEGADGLEEAIGQYKANAEKAKKDITEFWPLALEKLADPKVSAMDPVAKLAQVSMRFMSWKAGK